MLKKTICIGVIIVMAVFACVGCGVKYNAVIYDNVTEQIKSEYIEAHRTLGAYYGEDNIADDSNPRSRTIIIKNQEDFDVIFVNSIEYDVNFDSEMLLVYTFTSLFNRTIKINNVKQSNDILKIGLEMNKGTRPFQRFVLIKLDKLEITTVEISEKNF